MMNGRHERRFRAAQGPGYTRACLDDVKALPPATAERKRRQHRQEVMEVRQAPESGLVADSFDRAADVLDADVDATLANRRDVERPKHRGLWPCASKGGYAAPTLRGRSP